MSGSRGRASASWRARSPASDASSRPRARAALAEAILESATDYAVLTLDSGLRVTSWNAGATSLLGWAEAEALGMDSRAIFTPEDRERGAPEDERATAAAEGRAEDEHWHLRRDGSRFRGSGVLVPLRGAAAPGFLKVMRDVTGRVLAEERQRRLAGELDHRVRNVIALVQAVASQTARASGSLEGFAEAFEGRLGALARAHGLLTSTGWAGADLRGLVEGTLEPYLGGAARAAVAGPAVALPPRQAVALAMVLHELATNAVKHGALSVPGGGVEVAWDVDRRGEDGAPRVRLAWREAGGPAVGAPARRGFGTALVEQSLAYDLDGTGGVRFEREGLVCELSFPLG